MSVKASSHSRIKTIKVICDRCKQIVEGIRGEEFTAGLYDMTKWEEYRHENEQYVCDSCMFADPKYVEHYGSCWRGWRLERAGAIPFIRSVRNVESSRYTFRAGWAIAPCRRRAWSWRSLLSKCFDRATRCLRCRPRFADPSVLAIQRRQARNPECRNVHFYLSWQRRLPCLFCIPPPIVRRLASRPPAA